MAPSSVHQESKHVHVLGSCGGKEPQGAMPPTVGRSSNSLYLLTTSSLLPSAVCCLWSQDPNSQRAVSAAGRRLGTVWAGRGTRRRPLPRRHHPVSAASTRHSPALPQLFSGRHRAVKRSRSATSTCLLFSIRARRCLAFSAKGVDCFSQEVCGLSRAKSQPVCLDNQFSDSVRQPGHRC